jgi:hypothetical protein
MLGGIVITLEGSGSLPRKRQHKLRQHARMIPAFLSAWTAAGMGGHVRGKLVSIP